jgi:predicted chitinase
MAKGVKKIKWIGNSGGLGNYSQTDTILCIKPNQIAPFVVGEWYNDTTEEEKRRNITWLWMDQKKRNTFNKTVKPAGVAFGVNLPKKLCGSYAFYLEASLYGGHDHRNTGLHVYGKCEEKITASSWSKIKGTADTSEINYGHDLFITLETEGVNGDTLTLELYSKKKPTPSIQTVKAKCINGKILEAKFTTMPCFTAIPGLPDDLEDFYIKVLDITGNPLTNASGNDKVLSFTIKNKRVMPVFEVPTNNTPMRIGEVPKEEEVKIEGIITAYFAKEEFTKETTEVDGQREYTFANNNDNIDKNKIADIIKKKVDAEVKANKKYAKIDDIKNALTATSYKKNDTITFALYKLGAEFKKINSAPLEEEVYVVAKTFLLDGKEVSITIKEKDIIVVDADADAAIPVTEAKENGAELTTLKATVENGIAKIKVKLRPKADEDLKKWKEKLLKGKKEGTYSYKFKNDTTITADNKKQLATIICNNAKQGKQDNPKIADGKTAFADDVEKALTVKTYNIGDTISFDTYKTQAESLWLKVECQGDTIKHEGEFLKRDGEYFVIGEGGCPRCSEDFKYDDIVKIFPAADKNKNLAEKLIKEINNIKEKYEINSCIRKAHLINQFGSETGFNTLVEGIDGYSASTLKALFGYFKRHPDEAETYKGNLYEIAVRAYGLRKVDHEIDIISCSIRPGGKCNDLGNESKEDGYTYIGRGLIQLTGKYNYTQINKEFVKSFPGEGNLVNNPELLEDPKYAVMSAFSYWINNKLNLKADLGSKPSDVDEVTKIINKNLDESHYEKRRSSFIKAKEVFRLSECKKTTSITTNTTSVTIRLIRKWQTNKSTIGEFTIDNSDIKGYILEEKGPDTTVSGIEQRVPIGTYNLVWHNGTKFQNVLKLYNSDVSIDRAILIHPGNSAEATEGCLLPGSSKSVDWVSNSRDKLTEINNYVNSIGIENAKIIITNEYE